MAARRRVGLGLALAASLVMAVSLPAPPAAADLGHAEIELYWPEGNIRYGDPVFYSGSVKDRSKSCGFGDCDTPQGTVTVNASGGPYVVQTTPGGITPYADFTAGGGHWPSRGPHDASASFEGNFTALVSASTSYTITARPCETTLVQSRSSSGPGEQVTFTADVSSSVAPAAGSVTFFQDDGTAALEIPLGTVAVDTSTNTASLSIVAGLLPLGAATEVHAEFTPSNANHVGPCRSNDVVQTVVAAPPPTAQNDLFSTTRGQAIAFDILANDSSGNGGPFGNIEIVDDVDHGERSGTPQATTYTPDDGFVGDDSFTYFVRNDQGDESAQATVNIVVECTPTAANDGYTTAIDATLTVDGNGEPEALDNDDTCEETAALASQPAHGTLTGWDPVDGSFTYVPEQGYSGTDSFSYQYTTGPAIDSVGVVQLIVDPVPATPDEQLVIDAYETFLLRDPDDSGLTYWVGRLGSGTTPLEVVRNIALGSEATRGPVLTDLYDRLLDRAPDAAERTYWADQLLAGTRYHWAERTLLASDERYTASGGTDTAYVTDLYQRILGRSGSSSEIAYWVGRLGSGEERLHTVDALLNTPEARSRRVAQVAASILGRPATADEAGELGEIFAASRDPRKVAIAAFLFED